MPRTRECLDCGNVVPAAIEACPKCDANLGAQTDGSTVTIDIAHRRETRERALAKLDRALQEHRRRLTQYVRVVVGRGLIGKAAEAHLRLLKARREIVSYQFEDNNPGALIVKLKR